MQQASRAMQQAMSQARPRESRGRERARTREEGGTDWAALQEAFANSPTARKQAEKQAREEYERAHPQPFWKEAIAGALLPINTVFGPLRKGVEYGIGQYAQHAPLGVQRFATGVAQVQSNPLIPMMSSTEVGGFVDPKEAAKARPIDIINPHADFGYEKMLSPEQQFRGGYGFLGDVAFDPLTYVNPVPTARMLAGGNKAMAEGADAAETALRQAVKEGRPAEEIAQLGAARDTAAQAFRETQHAMPVHGRADRLRIIANAAKDNPEAFEVFKDEFIKGGQRGFNTMSPEARRALGVADPALHVAGFGTAIPKTGAYAERASQIGGKIRELRDPITTRIPGWNRLTSGPKGLEAAYRVLSRGGDEATPENAAALLRQSYTLRQAAGEVTGRGNRKLTDLVRKGFKGKSKGAIRTLMRDAELHPESNVINDAFQDVRKIYEEVSGDVVPVLNDNPNTYVTHLLTPGAKRFMRKNYQDPLVKDLAEQLGFTQDDLLEGSGFVEKARVFRPNADGTPRVFKLGPKEKELVVERGDIGELNDKLTKLFPGYKGKFYNDDPVQILESYVDSLAKGAGAHRAVESLVEEGTGKALRVEGDLATALNERNRILSQQFPEVDLVKEGYDPQSFLRTEMQSDQYGRPVLNQEPQVPLNKAPEMPEQIAGITLEDFFKDTEVLEASRANANVMQGQGRRWLRKAAEDVRPEYKDVRQVLQNLKTSQLKPIKAAGREAEKLLPDLEVAVTQAQQRLDQIFGDVTSRITGGGGDVVLGEGERGALAQQLATFMTGINADIAEIEQALASKDRYFRGVVTKERKALIKRMEGSLETLKNLRKQYKEKIGDLPTRLRAEADRRQEVLERPLRELDRRVAAAEEAAARQVGAPSKERLQWAQQVMAGSDDEARQELRDQYLRARELIDNPDNLPQGIDPNDPLLQAGAGGWEARQAVVKEIGDLEDRMAITARARGGPGGVRPGEPGHPEIGPHLLTPEDQARYGQLQNALEMIDSGRGGRVAVPPPPAAPTVGPEAVGTPPPTPPVPPAVDIEELRATHRQLNAEYAAAVDEGDEALLDDLEPRIEQVAKDIRDAEAAQAAPVSPEVVPPEVPAAPAPEPPPPAAPTGPREIPPELMAPEAPPGGWVDRTGRRIRPPRGPIPTYTDGIATEFAAPRGRGWGIQRNLLEPPAEGPASEFVAKQFGSAEEATAEIARRMQGRGRIVGEEADIQVVRRMVRGRDGNLRPSGWQVNQDGKPIGNFRNRAEAQAAADQLTAAGATVGGELPPVGAVPEPPVAPTPRPPAGPRPGTAPMDVAPPAAAVRGEYDAIERRIEVLETAGRRTAAEQEELSRLRFRRDQLARRARGKVPTEAGPQGRGTLPRTSTGRLTPEARQQLEEARRTVLAHEEAAFPTSEAARPRREDVLTSRPYDRDEAELYRVQEELANTPKRHTRVRAELEKRRRTLQAKFNPGGQHYSETQARTVLMEQADADLARAKARSTFDAERAKLEGVVRNQVDQDLLDTGRQYARVPYEGRTGAGAGQPLTEEQRINELRNQALQAGTLSPEAAKIRQLEGRIPGEEARLEDLRSGEWNPESEVSTEYHMGIPMRAEQAKMEATIPGTEGRPPMTVRQAVDVNQTARALRDQTEVGTQARIQALEREGIETQTRLAADMEDVSRLKTQRETLKTLGPRLEAVKPKAVKAGELDGVVDELEAVSQANPNLVDRDLNATESLLQTQRERLELLGVKDLTRRQVGQMVDAASRGKLGKVMISTLNDNWHMMRDGVLKEGDVIVDAQLHAMFQNLIALDKQPTLFGRVFSSLTNLFKTYATLSPGFHVRNALSGIFMNTADGVALKAQLQGANLWRDWTKGGEEWLKTQPDNIQDAFRAVWATGAGGRFTESGVASVSTDIEQQAVARIYNALASNKLTRFSQRWGEKVEGSLRLGMALDSMARGESLDGAIARITRVHFDYGQISSFDKTMKQVIPFWTFMSRNLPLQVSEMWTKPRAYAIYQSAVRNFRAEDVAFTPQYWNDAGAFNTGVKVPENNLPILGAASGLPIYLQPDLGVTRLSQDVGDIENLVSNPAGMLSNATPLGTSLLEYATKKNLYTDQTYGPTDYSKVSGPFSIPINLIAQMTGNRNQAGEVSENLQNFLGAWNPILERQQRLMPGKGDEEAKKRQAESIARFLGVPGRTLTPKQQDSEFYRRFFEDKTKQDVQEAIMRRQLEAIQQQAAG